MMDIQCISGVVHLPCYVEENLHRSYVHAGRGRPVVGSLWQGDIFASYTGLCFGALSTFSQGIIADLCYCLGQGGASLSTV